MRIPNVPSLRALSRRFVGGVVAFMVAFSMLSAALPAHAQTDQAPVAGANTGVSAAKDVKKEVDDHIGTLLLEATTTAVVSGLDFMASSVAYSLAKMLVTDCPGQKTCWNSKNLKKAFTEAGEGAIGDMIGTLNEELGLEKYGINLCNPDPRLLLTIKLGLLGDLKPKPKCELGAILDSYEALGAEIGSGEFLKRFGLVFQPGNSPLSASLNLMNGAYDSAQDEKMLAVMNKLEKASAGGGFDAIQDMVSKRIKSPPAVVEAQFDKAERTTDGKIKDKSAVLNANLAARAATSVAVNAGMIFAQTIAAAAWNRFAQGLLDTETLVSNDPDAVWNAEGLLNPGAAEVTQALEPQFKNSIAAVQDVGVVDMVTTFTTCPAKDRQPMNCVMDVEFAQAVRLSDSTPLTVAEAMKRKMLDGDRKFINPFDESTPSNKVTDRQADCYTHSYCYSNLKKLRAARIIPVGWELAAANAGPTTTLKEVVEGFEDCNDEGYADSTHPWCHLIDPYWVLKAPLLQCRASASGQTLLSSQSAERADACVDLQSCLGQDDKGSCTGGYGYCLKERHTWRFNGEQCPAQFSSCTVYNGADGSSRAMLASTVDQSVCNAQNSGCLEYSYDRTVTPAIGGDPADLSDDWQSDAYAYFNGTLQKCDLSNDGCQALFPLAGGMSLNLIRNGGFEEQEPVPSGANDFHPKWWAPISTASGHPYIEVAADEHGFYSRNQGKSVSGANAILLNATGNDFYQDGIEAPYSKTYTLSAELKPEDATKTDVSVMFVMRFRDKDTSDFIEVTGSDFAYSTGSSGFTSFTPGSLVQTSGEDGTGVHGVKVTLKGKVPAGGAGRVWLTFATTRIENRHIRLYLNGDSDEPTYIDNLQMEVGGAPTAFHEGYGAQPRAVHAKRAPSYLGCNGTELDRPECDKYAQICQENEVGCEAYTPVNGDAMVPGVIAQQDRCPAECAGYDTFKQEASSFEAEKFPKYFIPSTAKSCAAAEVGCSQFTDVETESVAYASSLRTCIKPGDPSEGTFYSWEGSDTIGYELKLWNLKETRDPVAMNAVGADVNAASDVCAGAPGCTNTKGPCTAINGDDSTCKSKDADHPGGSTKGLCSLADIAAGDLDCREFYDTSGNRHYRKLSKTIMASATCRQYRITGLKLSDCDGLSSTDCAEANEADCEESNGKWETDTSRCLYNADMAQSASCSAAVNGCRAYNGNAATNIRTVFSDDFETGVDGWTGNLWDNDTNDRVDPGISSESVTVGGHSMKISGSGDRRARIEVAQSGLMRPGRAYSLSFWARGGAGINVFVRKGEAVPDADSIVPGSVGGSLEFSDNLDSTPNIPRIFATSVWKKYDLGPVSVAAAPNTRAWGTYPVYIVINITTFCTSGTKPYGFWCAGDDDACYDDNTNRNNGACANETDTFFDNFVLKEVQDSVYLVKGSWKTPTSCDTTTAGVASPQEMLGCREYRTRLGASEFLRSFSRVCREKAIGCAAYGTTGHTTTDPYSKSKQAVCARKASEGLATVSDNDCDYELFDGHVLNDVCVVPVGSRECRFSLEGQPDYTSSSDGGRRNLYTDGVAYLAIKPQHTCPASQNSCMAMATPIYQYGSTGVRSIKEWKEGAYLYDATKFDTLLCKESEVSCSTFRTSTGAQYFKDPGSRTCEYRENVQVGSVKRSGWFIQGVTGNTPCPGSRLKEQSEYLIARNGETSYDRWVGSCPAEMNKCEEFIDPKQTSALNPNGQPYHYIADSRVTGGDCNGRVSLTEGCVLFDKTSNPQKLWNSDATYDAASAVHNELVSPSTSGTKDTNTILKVRLDRECSQWLSCKNSELSFDANQNKYIRKCTQLESCIRSAAQPANFYSCTDADDNPTYRLTRTAYSDRRGSTNNVVDWSNDDWSGYSVGNSYSPATISAYVAADDKRLYLDSHRFAALVDPDAKCSEVLQDCPTKYNSNETSDDNDTGFCIKGRCYYKFDGGSFSGNKIQCRAYPQADAPFGRTAVDLTVSSGSKVIGGYYNSTKAAATKAGFQSANFCTKDQNCECSYKRAEYGSANVFFGLDSPVDSKQCVGGANDGIRCDDKGKDFCDPENGTCKDLRAVKIENGWPGICLDADLANSVGGAVDAYACNLWLPVDKLAGAPDLANLSTGATGISEIGSKLLYCQVGQGGQFGGTYDVTLDDDRSGGGKYVYLNGGDGDELDLRSVSFDDTSYEGSGGLDIYEYQIAGIFVDGSSFSGNCKEGCGAVDFPLYRRAGKGYWDFITSWKGSTTDVGEFRMINGHQYTESDDKGHCKEKLDAEDDPGSYDVGERACFGLRMVFDKTDGTGKLDRIVGVMQADFNNRKPGIAIRIKIKLREVCKEVAYVFDPNQENTVWTDRFVNGYTIGGGISKSVGATSRPNADGNSSSMSPFGKIGAGLDNPADPPDDVIEFANPSSDDTSIPEYVERLLPIYSSEGGSSYTWSKLSPNPPADTSEPIFVNTFGVTTSGPPYACIGNCASSPSNGAGSGAREAGKDNLSQIFARSYGTYVFDPDGNYNYEWESGTSWDVRADNLDANERPRVIPVNTGVCDGSTDGLCNEMTSEGLTVNERSSGDQILDGNGRATVTIKHYAYANKDHMPIRSRTIDFGDGSPVDSTPGWYKNRRGCPSTTGTCSASTAVCKSTDTVWGESPESCDSRYYQDVHTYECTKATFDGLDSCGGSNTGYPCRDSKYCVFKPRVQVIDNWGVCSGRCDGGTGGSTACFNATASTMLTPDFSTSASQRTNQECFGMVSGVWFPRGSDNQLKQPWVAYEGVIKVLPEGD